VSTSRRKKSRPELPLVSEEMRRARALLAEEISGWPNVSMRLMFGFRAVYRDGVIFAMLPDKRALESPTAIAYKQRGKWVLFDVGDGQDLRGALAVVVKAYEKAARPHRHFQPRQ
jgi:hypothetical protein